MIRNVAGMLAQYLLPVREAALAFPAFALVLLVPFSFLAYRRRGRLGWQRSLVFFTFLYCTVTAFFLTLLPLPRDARATCQAAPLAAHPRWVPGAILSFPC